jgi:septal ring factor EnvC (AmiA/AmiB activator)
MSNMDLPTEGIPSPDDDFFPSAGPPSPPPQPKKSKKGSNDNFSDINNIARDNSKRMRVIEERVNNLRKSLQIVEHNFLKETQRFNTEIKSINSEIMDMKHSINELSEKIEMLGFELKETAKKEEIKVFQRYIDLWNPGKFASYSEVEKIVYRVLSDLIKEKKSKPL